MESEILSFPVFTASSLSMEPVVRCSKGAHDFLRAHPASAYTTAMTVCARSAIPLLEMHAARLGSGAAAVLGINIQDPYSLAKGGFAAGAQAVSDALRSNEASGRTEAQIVLVVSTSPPDGYLVNKSSTQWMREGVEEPALWLHVLASPVSPSVKDHQPVTVEARGGPRPQASIKYTQWVKDRRALEMARGNDVAETILMGTAPRNGSVPTLLEGLVTNLYVIMRDGSLWTASERILRGTIREVVLHCARLRGLQVIECAPEVDRCADFDTAFLTNAIKHLTPISFIRFPTLPDQQDLILRASARATEVVNMLREDVLRKLEESSSSLQQQ